jgi:hypothetical protein
LVFAAVAAGFDVVVQLAAASPTNKIPIRDFPKEISALNARCLLWD